MDEWLRIRHAVNSAMQTSPPYAFFNGVKSVTWTLDGDNIVQMEVSIFLIDTADVGGNVIKAYLIAGSLLHWTYGDSLVVK